MCLLDFEIGTPFSFNLFLGFFSYWMYIIEKLFFKITMYLFLSSKFRKQRNRLKKGPQNSVKTIFPKQTLWHFIFVTLHSLSNYITYLHLDSAPARVHATYAHITFKTYGVHFPMHRGALCQFPFRWICYCHSSKSTGRRLAKRTSVQWSLICIMYIQVNFE